MQCVSRFAHGTIVDRPADAAELTLHRGGGRETLVDRVWLADVPRRSIRLRLVDRFVLNSRGLLLPAEPLPKLFDEVVGVGGLHPPDEHQPANKRADTPEPQSCRATGSNGGRHKGTYDRRSNRHR